MGRVIEASILVALLSTAACDDVPVPSTAASGSGGSTAGGGSSAGGGLTLPLPTGGSDTIALPPVPDADELGAVCDPKRGVGPDGAQLIVRDPEVLADFSLERVLTQIAQSVRVTTPPLQLLQRLFDTENTTASGAFADVTHCDAAENPAFRAAAAVDCPRVEGKLATSAGMLTPGHRDFFAPVALVNRFDLAPSDHSTCGEYRIVYAKQSGLTDPSDRVFLIFEAALFNGRGSLAACRPVANLWAGLARADLATQRRQLSALFFEGVGELEPVLTAGHLGSGGSTCQYTGRCGQIRLGQGMQEPFQFRQFRLSSQILLEKANQLIIEPSPDSQSPRPELFDLAATNAGFVSEIGAATLELAATDVARVRARMHPAYDAGESAISGAAKPNFAERLATCTEEASQRLTDAVAPDLQVLNLSCPSDDPLTRDAIVQRATAVSCAGCHAPDQLLSEGRKLGCGAVWPKSQGTTHINERGELSPALTDVFLPYRAQVLSTYLQACDAAAIEANLQPVPEDIRAECFPAGTAVTLANGAQKAIEQVEPSEWVLSFDTATRSLVPARVTGRVVRENASRFVRINERLLATDNHPFFTEGGWVRAEDLQIGATLARFDGLDVRATSVEQLKLERGAGLTYNLRVEGPHNYFAGGMLVHDRP